MSTVLNNLVNQPYKHGFVTDIETEAVPKGLSEDVIRHISKMKAEPDWLLDFRLAAYRHWLTMEEPAWANVSYPKIDFQEIIYFAQPKPKKQLASMKKSTRNYAAPSKNSACRCTSRRSWPVSQSM